MELLREEDGSKMLVYPRVRVTQGAEPRNRHCILVHCLIECSLVFGLSNPLEYFIIETNKCPLLLKPH